MRYVRPGDNPVVQQKLHENAMVPARRVAELQVRADFSLGLGDEANVPQKTVIQLFDAVQRGTHRNSMLVVLQAPFSAAHDVGNF